MQQNPVTVRQRFSPMPRLPWLLRSDIDLWRVKELKRFWDATTKSEKGKTLWKATLQFVEGLHSPFSLILGNLRGELFLGWMSDKSSSIKGFLEASYPGIVLSPLHGGGPSLLKNMPAFASALVLSGNPSNPMDKEEEINESEPPGLDTLIQGLIEYNWLYVSLSFPLSRESQREELQRVYGIEKEMRARYLRPGTALERNNPDAEAALEEVKAAKIKLEEGLGSGLWHSTTTLFLGQKEAIPEGISLLKSLFSGRDARPYPLQVQICLADGVTSSTKINTPFTVLNSRDVARFVQIPAREYQGYPVRALTVFDRHMSGIKTGRGIFLGNLGDAPHSSISINITDLTKHLLIAGTTGSGKTNTCLSILYQAWKVHQIPFLVLETSEKTEYGQRLIGLLGDDLEVFTVGNESKNPLHLDILRVPPGRHIEAHLGNLMRIFKAAFPLPPPTPYLLEEGLRLWYSRAGWDMEKGEKLSTDKPLILQDLIEIITGILQTKYAHYDPQTRGNIESALLVRLESLSMGGMGYFLAGKPSHEHEWEKLLQRPMVMELSTLTDPDKKALAVLFILYRLISSANEAFASMPDRIHITVVEEAHRVLKEREASQHPDVADTQAAMVEEFANALSEVRYAGEGLIILDQMPSKLSSSVRANTNMKLAHRLPDGEEQRCIAQAAGLDEEQSKSLYRFKPGEALWLPTGGGVFHIKVPLFEKEN